MVRVALLVPSASPGQVVVSTQPLDFGELIAGVTEVVSSLTRDGKDVPHNLVMGTYVVFEAAEDNDYSRRCFAEYSMLPDKSGRYAALYRPIHMIGLELGISVASAALRGEHKFLGVVPMFHITGMVSVMHSNIYTGSTLVMMPRWDRDLAGWLISHWKVTNWTNIPTMVIDLLASPNFDRFDLSSLAYIGGGGAAMPQAVAQRLLDTVVHGRTRELLVVADAVGDVVAELLDEAVQQPRDWDCRRSP